MDFTAYHAEAKQTAIYAADQAFAYLIPAAADEAFEAMDAPRGSEEEADEWGDCLWTSVMLRATLDLPLTIEPFANGCHIPDHFEEPARALLHLWTKIARDRGGIPDERDQARIEEATAKIIRLVAYLAGRRGLTTEQLAAANLLKLAGRKQRGTLAGSGTR